jgi:hypothetical protein
VEKNINELGSSIDFQTLSFTKSNPVLDMLNVKYVIVPTGQGDVPITNPFANGNAWFVNKIQSVNSADEELKALNEINTKEVAVRRKEKDEKNFETSLPFTIDSLTNIQLISHKPNYLKYVSNNSKNGFGVFSEMYYENGWKATIDGNETKIHRVNYVLRGLQIPAGKHTIEFKFEPQVVKTGSTITLISSVVMLLLIVLGVYFENKKDKLVK